jgi:hypothetical protein
MAALQSCIYRGAVRHRRHRPRAHGFRYRLYMLYLDLDELDEVFAGRWLWSAHRSAPMRFRRSDYLGDPRVPLRQAVLDRVEERLGRRPDGAVRMLTNLRCFGYVFNPLTLYYCFAAEGRLDAVVAEITNTPWGERHSYVLDAYARAVTQRWRFAKEFHVSPFMHMDQDYSWALNSPGEVLTVHMRNEKDGQLLFDASLRLRRREISGASLATTLLRHPFMTAKVIAGIYLQAGLLWLKRIPFHPHPRLRAARAQGGRA